MRYAEYDPLAPEPQPVIGWYDNDYTDYPTLPDKANLIELTQLEWDTRNISASFISGGKLVGAPPPTDKMVKSAKWGLISVDRDRRKAGGFKVSIGDINKWFHSDADSRIQYLGLKDKARDLLAAGGALTDGIIILGQVVKWKTMDGSFVDVTAQVAFDIVAAAGDLDAQLFAAAEIHKTLVESSANPASYDFFGGWPISFGE